VHGRIERQSAVCFAVTFCDTELSCSQQQVQTVDMWKRFLLRALQAGSQRVRHPLVKLEQPGHGQQMAQRLPPVALPDVGIRTLA
jgi:hypothetical protein